jgi:hypothetical protein
MNKLSHNYFIKILLEMILEKEFETNDTGLVLYIYTSIVNNILSIYSYSNDVKSFNQEITIAKYPWYKKILFNTTFYNVIIIFTNIELLKILNINIDSKIINNYILFDIPKLLLNYTDYNLILTYNKKFFDELKVIIISMYKNFDLFNMMIKNKLDKFETNETTETTETTETNETNENFTIVSKINENLYGDLINYSLNEYYKINKINELVELVNLSLNLSNEQKILSIFWNNVTNKIGIIGFWNFILYASIKNSNNLIEQVSLFYKLNLFIYNGLIFINSIKKKINSISPYNVLNENILQFNKNSIWFVEYNINVKNTQNFEFLSENNLISVIASKFLLKFNNGKKKNVLIDDLKLICDNISKYQEVINFDNFPLFLSENLIIYNNDEPIIIDFNKLDNICDSITKSNLYFFQNYLTSNLISKEIGNIIFNYFIEVTE